MADSVITCDEIIDVEEKNANEKNIICKTQNFCILLAFLLLTNALLIDVSIYCYLIKYHIEQNKNIYDHFMTRIYIDNIN